MRGRRLGVAGGADLAGCQGFAAAGWSEGAACVVLDVVFAGDPVHRGPRDAVLIHELVDRRTGAELAGQVLLELGRELAGPVRRFAGLAGRGDALLLVDQLDLAEEQQQRFGHFGGRPGFAGVERDRSADDVHVHAHAGEFVEQLQHLGL